jgi:hypothetical protein
MDRLTLVVASDPFLSRRPHRIQVPILGRTRRSILREDWVVEHFRISAGGRELEPHELDQVPRDGDELVLIPNAGEFFTTSYLVGLLITILVTTALSYVYTLLVGQPAGADLALQRDDEESPVYNFNQIQTEYRPGFPVPIVLGRHDVGGQAVSVRVSAPTTSELSVFRPEQVDVVLVLSEGEVWSIGGLRGDELGGVDAIKAGTISSFRLDGNRFEEDDDVLAWIRRGRVDQVPIRDDPATGTIYFPGVSRTLTTNGDLFELDDEASFTINDPEPIEDIQVIVGFPLGLYRNEPNGTRTSAMVSFDTEITSFADPQNPVTYNGGFFVQELSASGFSRQIRLFGATPLVPSIEGPVQITIRRTTAQPGATVIDRARFQTVVWSRPGVFAYPRCALLAISTDVLDSSRPQFTVTVDGLLVRVWDADVNDGKPSSERFWPTPTSGDFAGIWTYDVGRNPAWVLAEFLTHPAGLGDYFSDDDIDWPAFRDWADFCDQDIEVDGVDEALCRCDLVIDTQRPSWDIVLNICQTGRASPVWNGRKLTVRYQYASAHGRGTNAVPERAPTQMISTSNVSEFTANYINTRARPAVLIAQILDEAENYVQTTIEVPDPSGEHFNGSTDNPPRFFKDTVKLYGITRRSQAERELLFRHRINRLVRSQITFQIGPEALAATVGDVLAVEHDVIRPFDPAPTAALVTSTGTSTSFTVDRTVTIPSGSVVIDIETDDGLVTRTVTSPAGTYQRGENLTISTDYAWEPDRKVVIGQSSKTTKLYEIISITLREDIMREVTAIEYHPEVHNDGDIAESAEFPDGFDLPDRSIQATVLGVDAATSAAIGVQQPATIAPAIGIATRREIDGRTTVSWINDQPGSRASRVWVRDAATPDWYVAAVSQSSSASITLEPHRRYQIAVAIGSSRGAFQSIASAAKLEIVADELPPVPIAAPTGVTLRQVHDNTEIDVSWPEAPAARSYEVLIGETPLAPMRVFHTTDRQIRFVHVPPDGAATKVWIRSVSQTGLRSPARLLFSDALPQPQDAFVLTDNLIGPSFVGNERISTWTSDVISSSYPVESLVDLAWTVFAEDATTVDELQFTVGSGEALHRLVDGRAPTPLRPGIDISRTVDDLGVPIAQLPPTLGAFASRGELGIAHGLVVEVRHARDSADVTSQPWTEFRGAFRATLGGVQVRMTLVRADPSSTVTLVNPVLHRVLL